ncbi:MAG: PDZ domain-containing protein, partial [Bacteroidales bacterium]|nr:PDZ domain-containing protein [Bacteroidales bacterium]
LGGKVKNIETIGEQSANGLSSIGGVLILEVPENSDLAHFGFVKSDVILACNGQNIKTFEQLLSLLEAENEKGFFEVDVMRDQLINKLVLF